MRHLVLWFFVLVVLFKLTGCSGSNPTATPAGPPPAMPQDEADKMKKQFTSSVPHKKQ